MSRGKAKIILRKNRAETASEAGKPRRFEVLNSYIRRAFPYAVILFFRLKRL